MGGGIFYQGSQKSPKSCVDESKLMFHMILMGSQIWGGAFWGGFCLVDPGGRASYYYWGVKNVGSLKSQGFWLGPENFAHRQSNVFCLARYFPPVPNPILHRAAPGGVWGVYRPQLQPRGIRGAAIHPQWVARQEQA